MEHQRSIGICHQTGDSETEELSKEAELVYPFNIQVSQALDYCNREFGFYDIYLHLRRRLLRTARPCTAQWSVGWGITLIFNAAADDYFKRSSPYVPCFVAHEFAHEVQYKAGVELKRNCTVGDMIYSEGTADYFALTHYPTTHLYPRGYSISQREELCQEAKGLADKSAFSNAAVEWLDQYPGAEYVVGYQWAQKYVDRTGCALPQLLSVKTKNFLEIVLA